MNDITAASPHPALPLIVRLGILIVALALHGSHAEATARVATFVQLSDVHLLDAKGDATYIANQTAMNWALLRVNQIVMSGKPIDFVVFTGGFGTEDLSPQQVEKAAASVAPGLRALLVARVFWIPGADGESEARKASSLPHFVKLLGAAMPDKQIIDLTAAPQEVNGVRFLGLDSTYFGSAGGLSEGLLELSRLRSEMRAGEPHVVFTHTTDLDGELLAGTGDSTSFWKLAEVRERWTELALADEIVAVFAGGVHSQQRALYEQQFGPLGAKRPPQLLAKTWLSPPLGSRNSKALEPLTRGILTATIGRTGTVSAHAEWFPPAKAKLKAEEAQLITGRLALEEGQLGEAESAFRLALASTDTEVRRRAVEGLRTTQARLKGLRWRLVDGFYPVRFLLQYWMHLTFGILVVVLYAAYQYHQRRLRIVSPQQLTDSAPAKLLHAELLAAIDHASQVLRREGQLGYSSPQGAYRRPSEVAQEIADSLPTVKGVDMTKLYRMLLALVHFLGWRLEAEVASTEHAVTVFVWLKWAWKTKASWRVPAVDEPNLTLAAAARQVALDVLWEMG